jgi:hypothetical protein
MSWETVPLWAKSKLFFEYAFQIPRDDPRFGLWCAMGLELLARAAVSKISPTLLAEPDSEHKQLLHALNLGSEKVPRKSINTSQVLKLCQILVSDFTSDDAKAATAIINCRNDELHTGSSAFMIYTAQKWIAGFYRCCQTLTKFLDYDLVDLLGEDEAEIAAKVLSQAEADVRQMVNSKVAAHKRVFDSRSQEEKDILFAESEKKLSQLVYLRHHRVSCPSCSGPATVQGDRFGRESRDDDEDEVVVRQSILPSSFTCDNCNLTLNGYAELCVVGLGDPYTRTTRYSPESYYGMVAEDQIDAIVEERIHDMFSEYDNE